MTQLTLDLRFIQWRKPVITEPSADEVAFHRRLILATYYRTEGARGDGE